MRRTNYLELAVVCIRLYDDKGAIQCEVGMGSTFDHLNIIRDEVDVVLDFQTGVPRTSQNEIPRTFTPGNGIHLASACG